jgi:alpha-N-acetylglucosamine transferase
MARLTRKTFMGDYAVAAPCRNEDEYLNALREVVQRLGHLEDEIEARENEEYSPLPFEEA